METANVQRDRAGSGLSMTNHWWRAHHGISNDSKLAVVALRAGAKRSEVLAVWVVVLDFASQNEDRGSMAGLDVEQIAVMTEMAESQVSAILGQLTQRGLIQQDGIVAAWAKRQPSRERSDDVSTDRVRRFRDKKRHETPEPPDGTPRNAQRREEESREENPLPPSGGGKAADGQLAFDQPGVVRPPVSPEEPRKSEAALAADSAVAAAAATIHARHPAGPRRDISANAVAKALTKILRHKHVTMRNVPEMVGEIVRVHAAWCATESWQKDGGEFAKGLENWLCASKGRYETAPVVSIRSAPASISRAWNPAEDEEEVG